MTAPIPKSAEAPYNLAVDWKFYPRYVVAPLHLQLEGPVFADLASIVEREINNPARQSYGHRLAGVIRHGEQIETTNLPPRFTSFLCGLAQHYIRSAWGSQRFGPEADRANGVSRCLGSCCREPGIITPFTSTAPSYPALPT